MLYALTKSNNQGGGGAIIQFNTANNSESALYTFGAGFDPEGSLIQSGSMLHGMTSGGGGLLDGFDRGTIFEYNLTTNAISFLHDFSGGFQDGGTPDSSLILSGSVLYGMTSGGGDDSVGGGGYGAIFAYDLSDGDYSVLHRFAGGTSDGAIPYGDDNLVLIGSTLYGTTNIDGTDGVGTLFALTVPEPSGLPFLLALGAMALSLRPRATRRS
jgi:uncharacterized repeat protein (TIGR03803 family)